MGWGLPTWLGGSAAPAQPESARPKSQDGGFVAPDRNAREICWESRDIFFECLDKNNILDAIKEDDKARKACSKEVADYEKDCARSWIKYFKQKRVMEYDRDRTLQRIQQDDAKMVAKAKADRKGGSWFG
ncbi:hypothetical protein LTR99_005960 [Exophiala xenobiotica]|uniref:Cytochrome c oxidase assembly factor 6 n=1 Tax=Vermiconidia calcicola TaxID=1690605 RepID=A0AAV9QE23_9PEZI|nr:hypothetical protein H2202_000167 [Exophiala xenobiotica]KAK5540967.1 hypothetical protein LTR25_002744 [Vermiconidia calcicola]KAK5549541.1 hypothetical protein LTR23_000649 [Chaetothyriales sp. CCFEE 6169]KAK5193810.1 hypothetical protein LTR92_006150 [Exophiala xenobiotica]KAK5208163.1 hypothetical protein LTR41_006099 [Exophiala xenobiotica]